MSYNKIKQAMKRDSVQTALMIGIIVLVVFALWFGSQGVLGTDYPALAVASGSMCQVQHMNCDGYSHPFDPTLHIGDLIIIKGINPSDINASQYPNGDIIIFHRPKGSSSVADDLIVHRAIEKVVHNGLVYFKTKGDGNYGADNWGNDYRGENYTLNGMISEKMVVGKVIMRIPWLGHLALFMRNSIGVYVIIVVVIILIIVEFAVPAFKKKPINTEAPSESSN